MNSTTAETKSIPFSGKNAGPIRGFLRAYLDHVEDGQPAGGKE
jgi:hypothetical protein